DANGNVVATFNGTEYVDASGTVVLTPTTEFTAGDAIEVGGIDISTSQQAANDALPEIRQALERVSEQRSLLGATQNRLDHTINNLQVTVENLQAAESRIRDTDMAKEMTEFTRALILQQAGTAMLAQANAAPQTVLQLLQ
ncbi:MAG TPA: flagellin, partial [Limnochordia bacterium]